MPAVAGMWPAGVARPPGHNRCPSPTEGHVSHVSHVTSAQSAGGGLYFIRPSAADRPTDRATSPLWLLIRRGFADDVVVVGVDAKSFAERRRTAPPPRRRDDRDWRPRATGPAHRTPAPAPARPVPALVAGRRTTTPGEIFMPRRATAKTAARECVWRGSAARGRASNINVIH